jgi:hypothetical protein
MDENLKTFMGTIFIFTVGAVLLFPIVDFVIGKEVGLNTLVEGLIAGILIGALIGSLDFIKKGMGKR